MMKGVLVLGSLAVLSSSALAQTGEYFLTAGDQQSIFVAQGHSTIRQWGATNLFEDPIAVASDVRTAGNSTLLTGTIYTTTGGVLGSTSIDSSLASNWYYDSTSDGTNHYLVHRASGNVYRTDNTYQNATLLFNTGSSTPDDSIGITYDHKNGTLWISGWFSSNVTEYTMSGTPMFSFSTGHWGNVALAYDGADGTLWLHDRSTPGTYEQWTTGGSLRYRGDLGAIGTANALGGEFAVPAPGSLVLLALGGLAATSRRRD